MVAAGQKACKEIEEGKVGEATPLVQCPTENAEARGEMFRVFLLGSLMLCVSAVLINYNKFLIAGPFPFATHLVLCHMGSGVVFTLLTLLVSPSMFPALQDETKRAQIDCNYVFCKVLPISIFFGASLVLSNTAYLYASVPFLQMMKEANVVLVYVLSVIVGVEFFKSRNALVLLFIALCTTMTVTGEIRFSLKGTIIQGTCQLFECSRLVLQSILLSGGLKLDALTYNLVVMPLCFSVLSGVLAVDYMIPGVFGIEMRTPSQADFVNNWAYLLPNFALAFTLNVVISLFIKSSSALSMILASLIKDMMVVVLSVVCMGEYITPTQSLFFALQLSGICLWSMLKAFPEEFENGIFFGLRSLCATKLQTC